MANKSTAGKILDLLLLIPALIKLFKPREKPAKPIDPGDGPWERPTTDRDGPDWV